MLNKGDKAFGSSLVSNSVLNANFASDKPLDTRFNRTVEFNAEIEETDSTFGSDFGEYYGLHIDESESIIALSVEPTPDGKGNYLTYIKANGSMKTIFLPDQNTTYSLGTDEVTGLTKIYATTGDAIDGTMSQRAITTELRKKVSVAVDENKKSLIFSNK